MSQTSQPRTASYTNFTDRPHTHHTSQSQKRNQKIFCFSHVERVITTMGIDRLDIAYSNASPSPAWSLGPRLNLETGSSEIVVDEVVTMEN